MMAVLAWEAVMARGLWIMVVAAALAGCARVDADALGQLKSGQTTVAEAISRLGRPDRDETLADGSRLLTYVSLSTMPKPANALPGLVYVWGGWTATTNEAGLMFDPDQRLRFWAWSSNTQVPIKVVGRDAQAKPVSMIPAKQDPLPGEGKGAQQSGDHGAD